MNNEEYAKLIIPNVEFDYKYYEEKYPPRNLKEGAMVTRFAPSPTGFVHMGSLYASFADLQMAQQSEGVALLRIEDTDQKREVENGIEGIIKDFDNLGIAWDEGPAQGGLYGPYVQSERGDIYRAFARKLLAEDKAYPCFCTSEELDIMRQEQELQKYRLGYYGSWATCRHLSKEEVSKKVKQGEPYIIRLKSPGNFNNKIVLEDLIKGNIEMPENDIDIVLIKSDGLPTYHFAHAVDDHLMRTTHVIRGDEWVSSYPIHHQLFDILGFDKPFYAHVAPITIREGETVRKLSKRKDPEASISFYHELGIPAEVIKLYLATINNYDFEEWYSANPDKKVDDYNFEFSKMPVGGSLFDIEKLYSIAKIYFSKASAEYIYNNLIRYTAEYDKDFHSLLLNNKDYSIALLNIEREVEKPRKDIAKYSDIKGLTWYMYDELFKPEIYQWQKINDSSLIEKITSSYIEKYYDEADDKDTWFNKIKDLSEDLGFAREVKDYKKDADKYLGHVGDVSTVLRVALTSESRTPDLYELMKLLGKDRISKRYNKLKEV